MTVAGDLLHPVITNEYRPGEGRCPHCWRRVLYVTLIADVPVAVACDKHNLAVLAMAMCRAVRVVPTYPPYKEQAP